jgi:hypothetical protein
MMFKRLKDWLLFLYQAGRGYADMATVYVTLIVKGYYTFEQVPAAQKTKVAEILAAMDLNTDGTPIE